MIAEVMLSCIDISHVKIDPKLVSRCFPNEVIKAMFDKDTGEMMEYRHLISGPKYREIWGKLYGK